MRQLVVSVCLGIAMALRLRQFDDEDFLKNDKVKTSVYNQARLLKNFRYKCGESVECLKYLNLISEQVKNKLQFSFGGPEGEEGPFGEQGDRGAVGLMGDKGDKGEKGPKGRPGQIVLGRKGDKGEKGDKGPKGETGDQGPRGDRGERGDPGPSGEDGIDGFDGMEGEKGDKGPKGEKGEKGPKGHTGIKGVMGKQGPKGPTGMQGPPGDKGKPGIKGGIGAPGPRGKDVNITETYLKINEVVMQQFDEIVNKINFGNNYGFINLTLVSELKREDQCLKEFGAYFLMCPDLQDCNSQDCLNAVQILKCCLKTTKVGVKAKELQKISGEITKDTYKWIAMLYVPEWKSIRHNLLVQTERCWLRNIQSDFFCLVPDTDLLKIKVLQNHKRQQIRQAQVLAENLQGLFDRLKSENGTRVGENGGRVEHHEQEEEEGEKEEA